MVIKKTYLYILFSLIYALWLCMLPHEIFKDRDSYLTIYAQDFDGHLGLNSSPLLFMFNEGGYFLINKLLSVFQDPSVTVRIIVFTICFSVSFSCFRYTDKLWKAFVLLILLFLNPQFFAMELVVLRQGLGLAILLLFFPSNRVKLLFLLLLLGLIHTSFYILFAFFLASLVIEKILKNSLIGLRQLVLVLIGIIFNVLIYFVSQYLGAKQELNASDAGGSGFMFLIWLVVLLYILIFKRESRTSYDKYYELFYDFSVMGLMIYLTGYFLSPISGRLIGTFIPFIYLVLLKRVNFLGVIVLFLVFCLNFLLFFRGGMEAFTLVSILDFFKHLLFIS